MVQTSQPAIAAFANADLWYDLLNPSRFGREDRTRAIGIIQHIRASGADMFGLAECFSHPLADLILDGVSDLYPHGRFMGPWGRGIEGIIEKYGGSSPRLARWLSKPPVADRIAAALFGYHSDPASSFLNSLLGCVDGDLLGWTLERGLKIPLFCGSGLVFFSKYPVDYDESEDFFLHPTSADVERLAAKGVARIRVHHPLATFTVFLTHLQAGEMVVSVEARKKQILHLKELIDASPGPVILMGDLNIHAGTEEYLWMQGVLGLVDSHHGMAQGTWFPERSRVPAAGPPQRYDYILLSRVLRAATGRFIPLVDSRGQPVSDHDGILAEAVAA